MKLRKRSTRSTAGTSLIELLVVIVVFLIGILAIAQIFPGGFRILSATRAETVSTTLAHTEMDRLRTFNGELPEQIVPVNYSIDGSYGLVEQIADINPDQLAPVGSTIQQVPLGSTTRPPQWGVSGTTWDVFNGTTDIGPWQYLTGPNLIRKVMGEGRNVTAPRQLGNSSYYGCLMTLQFAPILPVGPSNIPTLSVYANDMQRNQGPPAGTLTDSGGIPTATGTAPATGDYVLPGFAVPSYLYYVDYANPASPVLYIPEDPYGSTAPSAHKYRLSLVAQIATGSGTVERSYVFPSISVSSFPNSPPSGSKFPLANGLGAYYVYSITGSTSGGIIPLNSGESLVAIDYDSVRLAKDFDQLTLGAAFDSTANPDGTPHNPFQYEVVNSSLGFIIINPLAYGYVQHSAGGQAVPLEARADYDVYDWRILKEDFRLPQSAPFEYQLALTNIKHQNGYEPDNTYFQGIPSGGVLPSPAGLVLVDQDTGGVVTPTSYLVDYHRGLLGFYDPSVKPLMETITPGGAAFAPSNAFQHAFRIYYEGVGEWATQVLRASANYLQVSTSQPLPGQFFVAAPSGSATTNGDVHIRFPNVDIGQTISFDELWYQYSDGSVHCARGQSATVQADRSGGNPFVAITDIDPNAAGADFTNGYAVRGVRGLSVLVRVFNNPNTVVFSTSNTTGNISPTFVNFLQGWRRNTTEAILDKGTLQ